MALSLALFFKAVAKITAFALVPWVHVTFTDAGDRYKIVPPKAKLRTGLELVLAFSDNRL